MFENPNRVGGDLGLKIQTKNVGVCYQVKLIPSPRSLEPEFDFVFWLRPLQRAPLWDAPGGWYFQPGGWVPVSRGRRQQSHVTVSIFKGRSQQEGYKHMCPIFRFNRKGVWCACEQKGSLVLLSRARFSVVPGYALQTGMVPQALAGLTHPRTVANAEVELKIHVLNCLLSGGGGGERHRNQSSGLSSNLTFMWDPCNPSHK